MPGFSHRYLNRKVKSSRIWIIGQMREVDHINQVNMIGYGRRFKIEIKISHAMDMSRNFQTAYKLFNPVVPLTEFARQIKFQ